MNFEEKAEMCQLLNMNKYAEAVDLLVSNIDSIDEQSFDMFLNGFELLEKNFTPNIKNHAMVIEKLNKMKFGSMRTCMRAAAYEMIYERLTK
jgi:hypothetical protein